MTASSAVRPADHRHHPTFVGETLPEELNALCQQDSVNVR
jgi:hypothetical protein